MKLLFIDETGDEKFKDYLGVCLAMTHVRFYPFLKVKAQTILRGISWPSDVEFKGAYLFSRTKGCSAVEVEKRIKAAAGLLDLNAKQNARMKFAYGAMDSTSHAADYVEAVPELIETWVPKAPKGAGKNLIAVVYDERHDLQADRFNLAVSEAVERKGYVLFEHAMEGRSGFDTIGLMFADLVGYLCARVEVISNDAELFEGLTPEHYSTNGKIRKLQSSSELIARIKQLDIYRRAGGSG